MHRTTTVLALGASLGAAVGLALAVADDLHGRAHWRQLEAREAAAPRALVCYAADGRPLVLESDWGAAVRGCRRTALLADPS